MGWFETLDVVTEIMKRVEQQMWYPGTDGTPIVLCREQGLPGIENMQLNELRALLSSQPDFACLKPEIQEEAERKHCDRTSQISEPTLFMHFQCST